ncbi:hypothetical protein MSG28_002157 [Choristoneura fumiferana]|uniref:Uncharacterized protein n=1 Tax=Choristoneura fumiferana TaxID=7141 RepID=A0ACC0JUG0_CHOFU|nr:hypothetical protein MSG28_002157 [Choristoneura fumiferana]
MWSDSLLIVFISICTAFLGEVEKRKEAHGDSLDKQHKKKIEREEERLKNNNRDLSLTKYPKTIRICPISSGIEAGRSTICCTTCSQVDRRKLNLFVFVIVTL